MKRVRKFFPQIDKDDNNTASICWQVQSQPQYNGKYTSSGARPIMATLAISIHTYSDRSISFYVDEDSNAKEISFLVEQLVQALNEYENEQAECDGINEG